MKRILLWSLVIAGVASLAVAPAGTAMAKEYKAKVGGGPTGGTFNTFTNAMAVYVPKHMPDIKVSAVGSGGSVENVKRVHSGESDFGLCYAVDLALAAKGGLPKDETMYDGTRVMGFLYGAPAQLVVRADSGFKSAKDLVGKRVAVGNAGSGAAASAERFFRHMGIWDNFKPQFLGYSPAASAFKDGKIDAFWLLVGFPNRSIIEAAVQTDIALIPVGTDAETAGFYNEFAYISMDIPAGTYGESMPACPSFQDACLLTANKDVPEEVVYGIMKTLWSPEGMAAMTEAKKSFSTMNMENAFLGASVTLHPGAVKFWEEAGVTVPDNLK